MRVLVTGAAGFIGSNLASELEARGHAVVALDDFSAGTWANLAGFKGEVVSADLAGRPGWEDAVGEVDAVFHQAAITDTTVVDTARMMRANVEAFRALVGWAAAREVPAVVYASSAGVYGDGPVPMREDQEPRPMNPYQFSKRAMEAFALEARRRHPRLRLAGLRYFNVFGPREAHKGKASSMIWQLAEQMRAGRRPRIFEFGEQFRDFVYVRDVVEANLAALKAPSGVYNVCTGVKTNFNEVIEKLNRVLGTRFEPEYFKNPYSGRYQNETVGDPDRAASQLKFRARWGVDEAIAEYLGGRRAAVGV